MKKACALLAICLGTVGGSHGVRADNCCASTPCCVSNVCCARNACAKQDKTCLRRVWEWISYQPLNRRCKACCSVVIPYRTPPLHAYFPCQPCSALPAHEPVSKCGDCKGSRQRCGGCAGAEILPGWGISVIDSAEGNREGNSRTTSSAALPQDELAQPAIKPVGATGR